ncbi:MAG TPA: DNA polymerase III subunit gamma/tau, partial [Pseudolabrys sp.]|nr:DNA polymerase III subunit gamma/tau [Pseudolabrys sp.]
SSPRSSAAAMPRPADEPVASENAAPTVAIASFEALIALAQDKRDITMKMALERDVRLVRCEDGQLEIALEANAPKTLVHDLQRKITAWTGKRWIVVVSKEQGSATVREQADGRKADLERAVENDPLVQAVMKRFPGAKIAGVRAQGTSGASDEFVPPADGDSEAD